MRFTFTATALAIALAATGGGRGGTRGVEGSSDMTITQDVKRLTITRKGADGDIKTVYELDGR